MEATIVLGSQFTSVITKSTNPSYVVDIAESTARMNCIHKHQYMASVAYKDEIWKFKAPSHLLTPSSKIGNPELSVVRPQMPTTTTAPPVPVSAQLQSQLPADVPPEAEICGICQDALAPEEAKFTTH